MNRPRVLLADDHRMVTEGLKRLLSDDCDLVATVEDGHSLVAAAKKLRPDVIVADITMPHLNGIDAIARLKKIDPHVKVVFLTMHKNATYARRALEAGATGYVLKHSAPEELVIAIQAALKGETFITSALAGDVPGNTAQGNGNEVGSIGNPARARDSATSGRRSFGQRNRGGAFNLPPHGRIP